ncbi:helix-turn-helix domain-containing protein [Furfurilactobacillus milii]|uniref:helix-turn-helix domain-containing protein n=2 Tax=Furfurilactobacillus TaxID=2767882 RepID=UPI003264D70D
MSNNFKDILDSCYWTIGIAHDYHRFTLTSIYYQRAKGIQFETLKKICFFGITPNELLGYEVK